MLVLLKEHNHFSNWEEGVRQLPDYFQENKAVCLHALNSLGRDYIKQLVYALKKIVNALAADFRVNEAYKDSPAHFYTEAFAGVMESWL